MEPKDLEARVKELEYELLMLQESYDNLMGEYEHLLSEHVDDITEGERTYEYVYEPSSH
jgi:predicted metalloprotease